MEDKFSKDEERLLDELIAKVNEDFDHGELISHSWINENLWIIYPTYKKMEDEKLAERLFAQELDEWKLRRMSIVQILKKLLDQTHKKFMVNIPGSGYYILTPNEYNEYFSEMMRKGVTKIVARSIRSHSNVNHDKLTTHEGIAHSDKSKAFKNVQLDISHSFLNNGIDEDSQDYVHPRKRYSKRKN